MEFEKEKKIFRGRGANENPTDRFSARSEERDPEFEIAPSTGVQFEEAKSALSQNDSPDIPFTFSVNPYRGCEHGCVYCYARPTHEYLGMSLGLDFETKLIAKKNIAEVLRKDLSRPSYRSQIVAMSGITDPYQPIERRFELSRRCLEVFCEFRNPVMVISKSALVERDRDLLMELNRHRAAMVAVSVTTLDSELARRLEPRASIPAQRLRLVRSLADAGVPVGILMAPILPGLNDEEIPAVLAAAKDAGAQFASYVLLRLPHRLDELFTSWLKVHYPERMERVLGLIRQTRGGALKDARFGSRMRGEGPYAEQISKLFKIYVKRSGLGSSRFKLDSSAFRVPNKNPQLSLFSDP